MVVIQFGGRDEIEQLAHDKRHHLLEVVRHATHAVGGHVPPLLGEQESLRVEAERRHVPAERGEARIVRQRRDARFGRGAERRAGGVGCQSRGLGRRFHPEHGLAAGRGGEVEPPVGEGEHDRMRRYLRGEPGRCTAQHAVEAIAQLSASAAGLSGVAAGSEGRKAKSCRNSP